MGSIYWPAMESDARSARRPLDERALSHVLQRLRRAPVAPWLHGEAARRMAERLPVIRQQPEQVLDWWSQLGASRELLVRTYPRARVLAVEPQAISVSAEPARRWWPRRRAKGEFDVIAESAVTDGGAQLVWANMMLHGAIDPQAVMAQWHRALAVDGFLMFSTLGPGSLERLRALYRAQGWPAPFAPFVDMHDLGDMLVEAGFADPVMDQEVITLSWPDPLALLAELRGLGGNVDPVRYAGLRTPRWRDRLLRTLAEGAANDGRPSLQVELVYGHAFRPPPRPRVARSTTLPLADLRAMLRSDR